MLNEKSQILKLNISQRKSAIKIKSSLYESLYALFCLILEDPIESLWLEIFQILAGYLQLTAYQFDSIVNIFITNNFI